MHEEVTKHVKSCPTCQAFSRTDPAVPPVRIPVTRMFERVALDYVGPLPTTDNGNTYIIVATEALTGWPIARAVPKADAATTAQFLHQDIILQYGLPETILTDQGSHFINKLITNINHILEVKHLRTSPYHPQTNGMTERFNGTLCRALARLVDSTGSDWVSCLTEPRSLLVSYVSCET